MSESAPRFELAFTVPLHRPDLLEQRPPTHGEGTGMLVAIIRIEPLCNGDEPHAMRVNLPQVS